MLTFFIAINNAFDLEVGHPADDVKTSVLYQSRFMLY